MHARVVPLPLALGAGAIVLSACQTLPPLEPPGEWPGPQTPVRASPTPDEVPRAALGDPELPDASLRAAVQRRLQADGNVEPSALAIDVDDGVVTLSGTTKDLIAHDRLVEQVATVRGVRGVVDRVQVRPLSRTDQAIAADVRAALSAASALEGRELRVDVDEGFVTLEGEVLEQAEASHARTLARGVLGVRDVVDRLVVAGLAPADDDDIRAALEQALEQDARFQGAPIEVDVERRVATLTGTVESARHRDLAADYALAAGAVFVDVRQLEAGSARDEAPRPAVFLSDELVHDAVLAALARDPRLDDGAVRAEVEDGVVTLRGAVRTVAARDSASERALEARGVVEVRNRVRVRPRDAVPDAELSERVEAVLSRDPWLFDAELAVLIDDGAVLLAGELPTRYARARTRELVAAIEGVERVDVDRLRVSTPLRASDDELRASVLEELFWNPAVDAADVEVRVEGGVVWLAGEANDAVAVASARESAFLAGARDVVNEIVVPTAPADVRTLPVDDPAYLERSPFVPDTPFTQP